MGRRAHYITGTLWPAATPTRECGGMGDNYSALAIKTFGCYGSGNYPPVFRDLERALLWAKGTQYVVVPLKEAE